MGKSEVGLGSVGLSKGLKKKVNYTVEDGIGRVAHSWSFSVILPHLTAEAMLILVIKQN